MRILILKEKNKKILRFSFILLFLLSCTTIAFSQQTITLKKIYSTGQYYDLNFPIMVDSVNIRGTKFGNKEMLESAFSLPEKNAFTEELTADISEYFLLRKTQKDARFYLLSFDLNVDRYAKTVVRITAPSMFEAYINGVKETSKTTVEDTLTSAKTIKLNFPTNPGTYNILIKYMSLTTNKSPEGVKITIEPEDKDTQVNYTFGNLSQQTKRNITIRDILEGTRVSQATISPDGQYSLLTYATTKDDGKKSSSKELFIHKTNRRIQLPSTKNVRWMPTTSKLFYTDDNKGVLNLIAIDPETFTEEIIAKNIPSGDYSFTPDEKSLIYTDRETPEENKKDLIRLSRPESRQPNNDNRYFLSKYDLATGFKQRLTFGKESTSLNDISNDSRYILYSISRNTPTERPFYKTSMYKLDLQSLNIETLWENEGFANRASFSPDGTKILISGSGEAFEGIGNTLNAGEIPNSYNRQAFIMDMNTKQVEAITRDFNPSIDNSYWNSADGNIYFRTTDRDLSHIYRYNPKNKQFKLITLEEEVVRSISYAKNGTFAVYYGVGDTNSTRAHLFDMKNERSVLISDPGKHRLEQINIANSQEWTFTSSDGSNIDGRYYLPPNFSASKKYPMIVYYYGGTTPTQRTLERSYPPQVYAALGYIVYVLQPSGAIGYGQEFAARHVNAWGKRTADEIIEGTKKFVAEHPFVDGTKIGCVGASYGGFMTMYLQTQTDLFAAAVSHAGISSISSYWGEGYWGYTYSSAASANSYPWNNKELYIEQSPLFNADKISTPLLLLHGTVDTNVPVGESIQMYTALKILGKPVEFVQVKGEDHGVLDFKKRIEWNYSIFAWFAKWLQDDSSWWDSMYKNN